jgi:hypothetical protein
MNELIVVNDFSETIILGFKEKVEMTASKKKIKL